MVTSQPVTVDLTLTFFSETDVMGPNRNTRKQLPSSVVHSALLHVLCCFPHLQDPSPDVDGACNSISVCHHPFLKYIPRETLLMNPEASHAVDTFILFDTPSNLWCEFAVGPFVHGVLSEESTSWRAWLLIRLRHGFFHAQMRLTKCQLIEFLTPTRCSSVDAELMCWMTCSK